MNTITYSQRYLPHEINTKFYAVKLYRSGVGVSFVCRRYHISKSSLLRWNKKFDGTKESLANKSHRPLSKHPNSHTEEELKWIQDYHRRNPHISGRLLLLFMLTSTSIHKFTPLQNIFIKPIFPVFH